MVTSQDSHAAGPPTLRCFRRGQVPNISGRPTAKAPDGVSRSDHPKDRFLSSRVYLPLTPYPLHDDFFATYPDMVRLVRL